MLLNVNAYAIALYIELSWQWVILENLLERVMLFLSFENVLKDISMFSWSVSVIVMIGKQIPGRASIYSLYF